VLAHRPRQRLEVEELHRDVDVGVMNERKLLAVVVPRPPRPGAQLLGRPPGDRATLGVVQWRHRGLDRLEVARHVVVDGFQLRTLVRDGGVDGSTFGLLGHGERTAHGDFSRHHATVAAR
jgi:hypothetical protein